MTPITVWKRYRNDDEPRGFEFNHIEDGHIPPAQQKPNGKNPARYPEQHKAWQRGTWIKRHAYLIDGRVKDDQMPMRAMQPRESCPDVFASFQDSVRSAASAFAAFGRAARVLRARGGEARQAGDRSTTGGNDSPARRKEGEEE